MNSRIIKINNNFNIVDRSYMEQFFCVMEYNNFKIDFQYYYFCF